jgi:CBS domain-containing protein
MLLKDICVLDVASCGRDTGIVEAARLMRHHHTGNLVVIDDPQGDRAPVGIVTDRDIVVQVLAGDLDPAKTKVAAIMGPRLVIATASETVSDAIERMRQHGVRRLPVVDHAGSLMGIVTLDDLFLWHAAQVGAMVAIVSKEQIHEQRERR